MSRIQELMRSVAPVTAGPIGRSTISQKIFHPEVLFDETIKVDRDFSVIDLCWCNYVDPLFKGDRFQRMFGNCKGEFRFRLLRTKEKAKGFAQLAEHAYQFAELSEKAVFEKTLPLFSLLFLEKKSFFRELIEELKLSVKFPIYSENNKSQDTVAPSLIYSNTERYMLSTMVWNHEIKQGVLVPLVTVKKNQEN